LGKPRTFFLVAFLPATAVSLVFLTAMPSYARAQPSPEAITPIEHFVTVMQENHTFDNYFGTYPGADGLPLGVCMPVNPKDPSNERCVRPHHIDGPSADLDHSNATFEIQYNKGRLDGFVYALNLRNQSGELSMGHYDDRDLPYYWNLVDEYVLFDRFFSSDKGGSLSNHLFWVAARGVVDSSVPPTGFDGFPTIFDQLQASGVSWKFYVQNYDRDITFRTPPESEDADRISQVVWCPLLAMTRFVDDPALNSHIVDLDEYYEDLRSNALPAVSYIIPSGASEHPPGSIRAGQRFVSSLIHALMQSDIWESSAFMVTYDDWGGWYDHVPPPQVDPFGYGFRVPAFLVSAYAREGHIDSTVMDFSSISRFIEENWGLEPIAERDAAANTFMLAFDFERPPRAPHFISHERGESKRPSPSRTVIYASYSAAVLFAASVFIGPHIVRRRTRR
jgi:phospholipase C